jgi:hypothetical protein
MRVRSITHVKKPRINGRKATSIFFILLVILMGSFAYNPQRVQAALLSQASVELSNSIPNQTGVTYTTTFTIGTTASIKCILIQFDSSADMTGGVPSGLDTTSAVKGTLSGTGVTDGNWALYLGHNGSTGNGYLQFENSTGESHTASTDTITAPATTITNPSGTTFYAQITTYSALTSHTCSTEVDQSNVMALVTIPGVAASATVDPSLTFSVANDGSAVNGATGSNFVAGGSTSTTLPFGTVAAATNADLSQTLTTSTNAANGYSIYIRYSGTMKDANNDSFTDQSGTVASPADFSGTSSTSSFGFTTDSSNVSMGSDKWAGLSTTNTAIDSQTTPQDSKTVDVQYRIEPSNIQAPGTYQTTITYTATPSY